MEEHVYPQMYRVEKEHWWFVSRNRILLNYIDRRLGLSRESKILDVGCGTGAMLEEFSRRYQAFGIDFSPQAIDFCRKRGLANVRVGSLDAFPRDERFDLITMFDVVEHVEDDRGLLSEAHGRLSPGGHLLVAVPAYRWLWSNHDVVLHHKRRYTRSTLALVVRQAGFRIEHLTHFNALLFPLALTRRVAGRLTGSNTADDLEVPSPAVNSLLGGIFRLETDWIPSMTLPFGLSLLCLAQKA